MRTKFRSCTIRPLSRWAALWAWGMLLSLFPTVGAAQVAYDAEAAIREDVSGEEASEGGLKPRPPRRIAATDHRWDGGDQLDVTFELSPDEAAALEAGGPLLYRIRRAGEFHGRYDEVALIEPTLEQRRGLVTYTAEAERGQPLYFRVTTVSAEGSESAFVETTEPAVATREWFDEGRLVLAVVTFVLCASVVLFILLARSGRPLKIRKIAGLEAIDEAVGRATEMGRSCVYIPGIQDMNDIQTIAGINILSRVAKTAAEYNARVEVPTCRSLVMTTARETVEAAFLAAGRPDAYNPDLIYYVTDEQFGYVAYLSGMMVREEPAACFYMGSFFAESLILAETGNSIGAIQVAGTAQPSQLPFFVAACDYTLIGEELFAASAYLSGSPEELGSLKGQDMGKLIVAAGIILGCCFATWNAIA